MQEASGALGKISTFRGKFSFYFIVIVHHEYNNIQLAIIVSLCCKGWLQEGCFVGFLKTASDDTLVACSSSVGHPSFC